MRIIFLLALLVLMAIALIATFFTQSRIVILIATVFIALASWFIIGALARSVTRDFHGLVSMVQSFNKGNKTIRARAQGAKEIRQLADGINRITSENVKALSAIHAEEQRQNRFVGDVSHELRTPLASIHGAAETLMEGDVEPEYQQRFLSMIIENTERLTRLANDLIELTKIEGATGEIPLRRFNLRAAIDRAVTTLEPTLRSRGVDLIIQGDAPDVLGDMDRIQQVIVNLTDNSSRATGQGGQIEILLSTRPRKELGPHIHDKGLADVETFACLQVADNGPGISEEDLPHIFERFSRSQESRARNSGGAGIGLSIVKAIVTAHAGAIDVRNRPEGGALFSVYLPIPPEIPSGLR